MPISAELSARIDATVDELLDLLESQFPWLNDEVRKRPPYPRDRADLEIAMTRLGRTHQLLAAARMLARAGMGTAIASVVRPVWETWINTAWMLHDPAMRMERSHAFWAAGIVQELTRIEAFRRRDGDLIPELQQTEMQLRDLVKREPGLYERWCDHQGNLRGSSVHRVHWNDESWSKRCHTMDTARGGSLYSDSYDVEYLNLSLINHGEGVEIDHLMADGPSGEILILAGAGSDEALDHLITGCGATLGLVYELEKAYRGGLSVNVNSLHHHIRKLRDEFTREQQGGHQK